MLGSAMKYNKLYDVAPSQLKGEYHAPPVQLCHLCPNPATRFFDLYGVGEKNYNRFWVCSKCFSKLESNLVEVLV
jgi:hypothetical protein